MAGEEPELAAKGRPVWQGNKESKTCTKCSKLFTVYYRRHHCRGCGQLVCNLCSTHRTELPESYGYGVGKLRVCNDCWDTYQSLLYEAEVEKGVVQPPDYEKLRQEVQEVAKKYMNLPVSDWVVKEERGIKIGTQQVSWHPIFVVRTELTVKASMEKTRGIYGNMELWKHWNPYVTSRVVEFIDDSNKVFEATYEAPVIANRSSVFYCYTQYFSVLNPESEKGVTTFAMSLEHPRCPKEKGMVRANIMFCLTSLEAVDNGQQTKFTSLVHSDPRGLLPPFLVNRFLARGADHLHGMREYIETH